MLRYRYPTLARFPVSWLTCVCLEWMCFPHMHHRLQCLWADAASAGSGEWSGAQEKNADSLYRRKIVNLICASFFLSCLCSNPQQVGITAANLVSPPRMALLHALQNVMWIRSSVPAILIKMLATGIRISSGFLFQAKSNVFILNSISYLQLLVKIQSSRKGKLQVILYWFTVFPPNLPQQPVWIRENQKVYYFVSS